LSPFWIFHKNKKNLQHHPAAYMNNHGGMGPQRGGNDPVLGGHMHQLSSHSPTMGSPESKPVIQASMLAAYQGKKNITFLVLFSLHFILSN
jgi:2',3'-cyclic-nucleotide 2'-phosphodiesterase (5'-nucleotidase family)